ncbi:hypothetical protein CVD28_09205 [Bacillus sp. M6-12]|uniref:hypothetical protein n=1 Tax=Bacillus sp. M6-12 TaxID=2054166 RepID=UPI000C794833|nr:hypothetical protein [Bacillus sp. M6-12]PLS17863.1 hypothetical protein CVD28_09205 [Bacillus sp. M6-12]
MQISNQKPANQSPKIDNSLEVNKGDIYNAQIKERVSSTEAVLQIRGKEVLASFEAGVPAEDRITVQIVARNENAIEVKSVIAEQKKTSDAGSQLAESKIIQSLELSDKEYSKIKQAVHMFVSKGIPITKHIAANLKEFFVKETGSTENKLNTVKALANKGLEPTSSNLRAVHAALHGPPLNEVLSSLVKEIDPQAEFPNAERITVQKTGTGTVSAVQQQNRLTNGTPSFTPSISALQELIQSIKTEPNIQKTIQNVRDIINKIPGLDSETIKKVEKATLEAEKLQSIGKERLIQVLREAEGSLQSSRSQVPLNLKEGLKELREHVAQNPELKKVIDKIINIIKDNRLEPELSKRIATVAKQASQLEFAGREKMSEALKLVETVLSNAEKHQNSHQNKMLPINSSPAREQSTSNIQFNENLRNQQIKSQTQISEQIKNLIKTVQIEPNIIKAIEVAKTVLGSDLKTETLDRTQKAINEAIRLVQSGQAITARQKIMKVLSEIETEVANVEASNNLEQKQQTSSSRVSPSEIKDLIKTVQTEPNIVKAIEAAKTVLGSDLQTATLDKAKKAINEAARLVQSGQDIAARQKIMQVLSVIETEVANVEGSNNLEPKQQTASQTVSTSEIKALIKTVQTEPNIVKAIEAAKTALGSDLQPATLDKAQKAINEAARLVQTGQAIAARQTITQVLSEIESEITNVEGSNSQDQKQQTAAPSIGTNEIKNLIKTIQNEPNLLKAIETTKNELLSNLKPEILNKVEKTVNEATRLAEGGREIAARQKIMQVLSDLEKEFANSENKNKIEQTQQAAASQYNVDELLSLMQTDSKNILVTKVTKKLAEATQEFRDLKREMSRNLDNVQRVIDVFKKNAYPQAKQMLETTISKLDNAILKSDLMLLTDMKTEKQLLEASSQLADAKKNLAKGDFSEASRIVREVRTLIDKIIFKPSDQKVMHFVAKESLDKENSEPPQQLVNQYKNLGNSFGQEPSARQMFEYVRSLGINHESDLANSLVFSKGDQSQQEKNQQQENLKSVLLKLTQFEGEELGSKMAANVEQAINNITGQQLLSKSDANGTLQSMFFNLPLLLGGKSENVQVFVNSKNEGQQVDWENCSIYFLFETNKLGDVGILLNASDRNLSITIKNDKPGFKEKMEPLASIAKIKLEEIGYNINSMHFSKMNASKRPDEKGPADSSNEMKQIRPVFAEKGMDYKI